MTISRLAPTPSGYLHEGNGVNFVLTYLLTCKENGKLHLRIDDYDTPRIKDKYIDNIFASLEWLEIQWDSGAKSPSDYHENFKFSKEKYLSELKNLTPFMYACECSRKDIKALSKDGTYPKTCAKKGLNFDPSIHSLRVHVEDFEDFIIWRKGDLPSYNFASLIDDKNLKTSLIVRGKDLRQSTLYQLKLAKILKIESFINAKFIHHELLTDKNGVKLSKSTSAPPLLNKTSKQLIYKQVAHILNLPNGVEDNMESLKEAFLKQKTPALKT